MSKIIKLEDGQLVAEDPDNGERVPVSFEALEAGSVSTEKINNIRTLGVTTEQEILDAINELDNIGGGIVWFEGLESGIDTEITYTADNIWLRGYGPGATEIEVADSAPDDFKVFEPLNSENVRISHLSIDGNKDRTETDFHSAADMIDPDGCTGVYLHDLVVRNSLGEAYDIDSDTQVFGRNLRAFDCAGNGLHMADNSSTHGRFWGIHIENCGKDRNGSLTNSGGVVLRGGNIHVENITVLDSRAAASILPVDDELPGESQITVSDFYFEGVGDEAAVKIGDEQIDESADRVSLSDGYVLSKNDHGIRVVGDLDLNKLDLSNVDVSINTDNNAFVATGAGSIGTLTFTNTSFSKPSEGISCVDLQDTNVDLVIGGDSVIQGGFNNFYAGDGKIRVSNIHFKDPDGRSVRVEGGAQLFAWQCNYEDTILLETNENSLGPNAPMGLLNDQGDRNVVNGYGFNDGDPSETGEWNTEESLVRNRSAVIWDESQTPAEPYTVDGPSNNWVRFDITDPTA